MSLNPVSTLLHTIDPQMGNNQGEPNSCLSTAFKAAAVVVSLIASMGTFAILGTLPGIVVSLFCGASLLALFNSSSHDHSQPHPVPIPWYHRIFSRFPSPPPPAHVPVGQGRHQPRWYDGWRFMNQPPPPSGPAGHVPVGGGHRHPPGHVPGGHAPAPGHVPVGGGHAPVPGHHVPVGRGHAPVPGHPAHGQGPVQPPPPSGPGGHVPVGRR